MGEREIYIYMYYICIYICIYIYCNYGIILGFSEESEIRDALGLWLAYDATSRIVVWWFLIVLKANPNMTSQDSFKLYNVPKKKHDIPPHLAV
jgi:hypothetical protein